jgi:hypothetical protein
MKRLTTFKYIVYLDNRWYMGKNDIDGIFIKLWKKENLQ